MVTLETCKRLSLEVVVTGVVEESQLLLQKLASGEPDQRQYFVTYPHKLRVLVVADEHDTTDGFVHLARRWGHAARVAYDSVAALRVASEQNSQVVLVDLEMPHTDGCQVAKQLRVAFPEQELFIIAIAGQDDGQQREQCSAAGIDLVLLKPLDPSVVETLLTLESSRANRARTNDARALAVKDLIRVDGKRRSAVFTVRAGHSVTQ